MAFIYFANQVSSIKILLALHQVDHVMDHFFGCWLSKVGPGGAHQAALWEQTFIKRSEGFT